MPLAAAAAPAGGASSCARQRPTLPLQQQPRQQRWRRRQQALEVTARDGKKRRKPAARDGAGSVSGSGSFSEEEPARRASPPPRRVDPSVNISVTRQLMYAKWNKEYERFAAGGFKQKVQVPQAFRKDSQDPDEYRRAREARERVAAEAARQKSELLTLQSMFGTALSAPGEQPTGVTLVDGYNLLYKWRLSNYKVAELMAEKAADPGSNALEEARQYLLSELDVYSNSEGMYVHVVFDAMGRGFDSQHNKLGMIVSYTGRMEADSFIMKQAQEYISQGVSKVCIVTDDVEITELGINVEYKDPGRQAVCSSSCGSLLKLVDASQKRMHDILARGGLHMLRNPLSATPRPKPAAKSQSTLGGLAGLRGLRNSMVQQESKAAKASWKHAKEARQRAREGLGQQASQATSQAVGQPASKPASQQQQQQQQQQHEEQQEQQHGEAG